MTSVRRSSVAQAFLPVPQAATRRDRKYLARNATSFFLVVSSVGARHVEDPALVRGAVPERANSTSAPLSTDPHAPNSRTAGLRPAPFPPPTTQQEDPQNSQQETERHKSLLDLIFHRTPTTKASANSAGIEPGQTPPSASKTQSENATSPQQNQQGTAISLPAPNSRAVGATASSSSAPNAAPSTPTAAATAPQSTAEIPAADLAPLYNYVQNATPTG
jgi:hypothetical protein